MADTTASLFRKPVAQVGVLLFVFSMLAGIFSPFLVYSSGWLAFLPILTSSSGVFVLFLASVLSTSEDDRWGSMWPLVGYDNAIDAIYTRGPWWARFEELEQQARERAVTTSKQRLFDTP